MLPEQAIDYLESKEYEYEFFEQPESNYLLIHQFPLPDVYMPCTVDLLLKVPHGYPNAPMDMFWTIPTVRFTNGAVPVATEHHEQYLGKSWQRWSRHIAWRTGIDNIRTFITAIRKEIAKGI
jgi:hypothetical protein